MNDEERRIFNAHVNAIARSFAQFYVTCHNGELTDIPQVGLALFLVMAFGEDLEAFLGKVMAMKAHIAEQQDDLMLM